MAKKATHFWIDPDELARKGIDYCSHEAQWLWLKVMRILHASERYGHFTRDGKPVTDDQAARRCGIGVEEWIALRDELTEFDLLKRTGDGIIFSPELVAQAEWRAKEAKRQKEFQDKKRREKGKTNGEYNGYITDGITDKSRPNLNSNSFSSSDEKEKGSSLPAAAKFSQNKNDKETLSDYLLRKQLEFPQFDVHKIYAHFKSLCGSIQYPHLRNTKQQFDKWLENQEEELPSENLPVPSEDRQTKIDACSLCDRNGYRKVGDGVAICKHEQIEKVKGTTNGNSKP